MKIEHKWTDEETNSLIENWSILTVKELMSKLNRTKGSIYNKAKVLNLGVNGQSKKRSWTDEDIIYLSDNWGNLSMKTLAKNLNRTVTSVQQKAVKLSLGPFLENGEYITLNKFMKELRGDYVGKQYTIEQWMNKGFIVRTKRVKDCSFKVVYLEDFWKWAEKNQTIINFSKLEPLVFGKEPDWVKEKRRADIEKTYYKKTPWTETEDSQLKTMLDQYRYTYRELSLKLKRTEGALKRRMIDLKLKARPIRMGNHNPWTEEETGKLIELYHKGHSSNTMPNYINRSAQSCSGKVEQLIKKDIIQPRSEFRKSC